MRHQWPVFKLNYVHVYILFTRKCLLSCIILQIIKSTVYILYCFDLLLLALIYLSSLSIDLRHIFACCISDFFKNI